MVRHEATQRRAVGLLALSNMLGGVGVASGIAVGALLAQQVGGTAVAGLAQAASVLGAALAAIPLATMATRRGRRWSLTAGYVVAFLGACLILGAAVLGSIVLLLLALGIFGVAQATNLQSRYAAADGATPASRATSISVVMWATTIGSVAGPNLSAVGERLGTDVGVPGLAGPYLFSAVAFALAATLLGVFYRAPVRVAPEPAVTAPPGDATRDASVSVTTEPTATAPSETTTGDAPVNLTPAPAATTTSDDTTDTPEVGAMAALRWAMRRPVPRFAVTLIAVAHAVMVMVMVMTPVHMQHGGMSLELVGVVISLHVLGMYAFSPVFGWLVDRVGGVRVACGAIGILTTATALGFAAAVAGENPTLTAVALVVLGLGWSAALIAASSLLSDVAAHVRVPLQGATDAGMNYAGAVAAAVAGPILAAGGFRAVNLAAALLLLPAVVLAISAVRSRRTTPTELPTHT